MEFTYTIEGSVDGHGRQPFTMTWTDPEGVYRPELGRDGKPVGYRRGQCFRANVEAFRRRHVEDGHTVTIIDQTKG